MTVRERDHHDESSDLLEFVAGKAARGLDPQGITEEANLAFSQGVLPGVPESTDGYKRRRYTASMIDALLKSEDVRADIERIRNERQAFRAEVAKSNRDEQLARARLSKQRKREQELVPDLYERFLALEEALRQLGGLPR